MAYINNLGQVRIGVRGWVAAQSGASVTDSDATAFVTAAGITDSTQISALNTLVTDLKTYGLWTKMKAIYPFVGGSAASHKFNLKDPRDLDAAYRLVFNGGWTHTSNGAKPNGTTGYADTKLIPSVNISNVNSVSISNYSRTQDTSFNGVQIGCYDGSNGQANELNAYQYYSIISRKGGSSYQYSIEAVLSTETNTKGFLLNSRTSSSIFKLFFNNNLLNTNTTIRTGNLPTRSLYIGASNWFNGTNQYSPHEHAFDSIGDGLTDTEASNFYISVQKFQTTLGRQVGTPYVSDPDAIAFLMAAGINDSTQAAAINTLVIRMKADGVWTKMKAIYPFVGGSATSHKFNLKDPRDLDDAFRLVFNGGWTHSSTGALPNGTTGYADTKFNPYTSHPFFDIHYSIYSRTDNNGGVDIGNTTSPGYVNEGWLSLRASGYAFGGFYDQDSNYGGGSIKVLVPDSLGMYIDSAIAKNNQFLQKNNSILGTWTSNSVISLPANTTISIGAVHDVTTNTYINTATREYSFASFGFGLTTTEATNLYTAVQAFQTTLGRQVNVPLVSDTDAQSFLNAANITSFQQASAVNKLVVDLKAAGVWTKMKAIYPFVGGSAASHKFNLKDPRDLDAAFRLVFNGGWTHTGTGALPNGTTGYADTKLTPLTHLLDANHHYTYYSRSNGTPANEVEIGASSMYGYYSAHMRLRLDGFYGVSNKFTIALNGSNTSVDTSYTNTDSRGFYQGQVTSTSSRKLYKNGVNVTHVTQNSPLDRSPWRVFIGSMNEENVAKFFSKKETAFVSIGDGLTDSESSALYTAVETYQTSLGRGVNTPIYNNGLVLNLDAGNANSYPGTGTTWFDLAAGNNGTLVNGPTYDTANGGTILFDGIDDKLTNGTLNITGNSPITLSYFGKMITNQSGDRVMIIYGNDGTQNQTLGIYYRQSDNYVRFTAWGLEGVDYATGFLKDFGVWHKWDVVYTGTSVSIYRDGILDPNGPKNRTLNFTANRFQMGYVFGTGLYSNIQVSNVQIYNRALSATEILNNFNSTRGRFGL